VGSIPSAGTEIYEILQATDSHDRARKRTDAKFIRQQFVNEIGGKRPLEAFTVDIERRVSFASISLGLAFLIGK
jgi:hypothetical protein